jgi:hypothetical protein
MSRIQQDFVSGILSNIHPDKFGTFDRIKGMLTVIGENFFRIIFFRKDAIIALSNFCQTTSKLKIEL